jgi:hypothetical protein
MLPSFDLNDRCGTLPLMIGAQERTRTSTMLLAST